MTEELLRHRVKQLTAGKHVTVEVHGDARPEVQRLVRETLANAGFNVEQPPAPGLQLVAEQEHDDS